MNLLPCSWGGHRLETTFIGKTLGALLLLRGSLPIPLLHPFPYRPAVIRGFSPRCTSPSSCSGSGNEPARGTRRAGVRATRVSHIWRRGHSWVAHHSQGFPPSTGMKSHHRCRNSIFFNKYLLTVNKRYKTNDILKLFTRFLLDFLRWGEGITVVLFAACITPLPFFIPSFYSFSNFFFKLYNLFLIPLSPLPQMWVFQSPNLS